MLDYEALFDKWHTIAGELRAENERLREECRASWQPIETAPKDTAVLTYGFGYEVARHDTTFGWVAVWDNRAIREPVAWMPLPVPPQDSGNRT